MYKNTLNTDGLAFPVDFRDVPTFEQMNASIGINVLLICVEGRFTNNPQLEPYDSGKPHSYIAYLDAKNLYGTTLSEPLMTGNFRFLCEHEISDFDVIIVKADDPVR